MLRPLLTKSIALAAGVLLATSMLFNSATNAAVIVDASVDGGLPQTIVNSGSAGTTTGSLSGGLNVGVIATTSFVGGVYPNLQLISGTTGTADSLVLRMTLTGITSPDEVERFLTAYSLNEPVGAGSFQVESFIDAGNTAFGTTTPIASGGPFFTNVTGDIFTQLPSPVSQPFSLTLVNTLTDIRTATNFSSSLIAVPEPGSLGLLGTGLVLAGFALRRRRQPRQG